MFIMKQKFQGKRKLGQISRLQYIFEATVSICVFYLWILKSQLQHCKGSIHKLIFIFSLAQWSDWTSILMVHCVARMLTGKAIFLFESAIIILVPCFEKLETKVGVKYLKINGYACIFLKLYPSSRLLLLGLTIWLAEG